MPIVDSEQLLENLDGDLDLLRESLELFGIESQSLLAELRAAAEGQRVQAVTESAHKISGMLATFFAEPARQTAIQLEEIEDAEGLAQATPLIELLSRQIQTVQLELQQITATGDS